MSPGQFGLEQNVPSKLLHCSSLLCLTLQNDFVFPSLPQTHALAKHDKWGGGTFCTKGNSLH